MTTPYEDLVARLAVRPEQVLVIAGSGVSIASTGNAAVASWRGLLEHGVEYCKDHFNVSESWIKVRREQLELGELVEVASEISKQLGAPKSGRFAGWLQETVGNLAVSEPSLIRALASWGTPIATTNYDTLISQQTNLEYITWMDSDWLLQFFRGEIKRVLHLHGVYARPETVVLGAASYEDVVRNRTIQDLMRALFIGKTLVFVGCGPAGLDDPNIGSLMRWYREVLGESVCPSYLLAIEPEREAWQKQIEGSQIRFVSYGTSHSKLPAYLEKIAEQASRKRGDPEQFLQDLIRAQHTFDQTLKEVTAREEELGPDELTRQIMELVRLHWQAGGKRSAWMTADGIMQHQGKALPAEERVRFSLELAEMMFTDGMPDNAFETLREILPAIESAEIHPNQRQKFWELQSRCLTSMGPYEDVKITLSRAIDMASDENRRMALEAELMEIGFLRGEEALATDDWKGTHKE